MNGHIDYSRLTCSLCTMPYNIPQICMETFFTGIYGVDLLMYHSTGVSIVINYLSVLYGAYTGQGISERLVISQLYIYLLYTLLYGMYFRVRNIELYADIVIERRAYIYMMIQFYSSYMAMNERYVVMSLSGMFAHALMWKEHIKILQIVNMRLIQK